MISPKKKRKSATAKPVPAIPTKQVAVLEADEESTDLLPQGTIRSEVNFLTLPFFSLSRKDAAQRLKTEYYSIEKRGDTKLEVSWKVSANPEYGYPGIFDRKVHKAIEQIISNLPRPIENPIPLGSLRNLAKLIGVGLSKKGKLPGKSYKEIQDSLTRITMTGVHSKGTFYDKGKKRYLEAAFHLYDQVVFTGEDLPNGEAADTNYVFLGNRYLENVNARYVKPLDYTYYRSLQSPIASRLYELLGVKFYGMGKYPFIRYRYSNLCQLLPVTQYQRASKAKEILNPAHEELINTGFLNKVEWDTIQGENHDWYVTYYPGTRAKEEIKQFSKQVALPPPEDSVQATPQPTPVTPPKQVADDVVVALTEFGISKKQAQRVAKDYPHDRILEQLELVKWLVETNSPLVSKNPQGFLVKAVEEGYLPKSPIGYKASKAQEANHKRELEQQHQAQEEFQRAREQARQLVLAHHPPQPIAGTEHTTESAWSKVLASLQEQVTRPAFATWLKDTLLLRLDGNMAFILVQNAYTRDYLERRLYQSIVTTLEQVLGHEVQVEFVVSEDTT